MERISRQHMFMDMAGIVAKRSTCLRSQVGALIVRDGRVVSMGYNGPVSGAPECKDIGCLGAGCDRSIHAELNAILYAARAGISVDGCTMYCTLSPCLKCAQAIVNSGIRELWYKDEYRSTDGLDFLKLNMVHVERWLEGKGGRGVLNWIGEPWARTLQCPHCGRNVSSLVATKGICPYCYTPVGGIWNEQG